MQRLAGKVAIVTGAGSGIGQGIAERLGCEGAKVIVDYVGDPAGAEKTKRTIEQVGGTGEIVLADVTCVEDDRMLVDKAWNQFGSADILVNNAGMEHKDDFCDVTQADYDKVMAVNLRGPFFLTQAFVRRLRDARKPGRVVNISSVHEDMAFPGFAAYCCSKGGLRMLMRDLAVELGSLGITVNNVAPGAVATPINTALLNDKPKLNALLAKIPLGRLGSPEDVAGLVAFLASDEGSYVTGATFVVDGGLMRNYQEQQARRKSKRKDMTAKIEDYALIGDCETAALVDRNGSIDWLCWPDFSSEACLAALLGTQENGFWKIAPTSGNWTTTREYREHTLILVTTFEHVDGAIRLTDFMPVRAHIPNVIRIVEGIRGSVDVRMELALRFDYGRTVPWVTRIPDGVRAIAGPNLAMLHATVPVHGENLKTVADFKVSQGEQVSFTLTYGISYHPDPVPIEPEKALRDTTNYWQRWSSRLKFDGRYRDAIERSLITLKAMTFRPTGGVVAAVTTSLPEAIGGRRNWDYRYCWLRDTTFTLLALTNGGYFEEAEAWQDWLLRALAGSPDQVQIMYGLKGERQLVEWEAEWLAGYENSRPVRIGNAAALQVQLDIYGEVLDSFFHAQHNKRRRGEGDFRVLVLLLEHLETIWQQLDKGIWETRGEPQQFTYSKMMAWVAFDRATMLAEQLEYDAPVEKWRRIRAAIHQEICSNAFNEKKNSFTQAYGSEELDAALLLMPVVGFLPGSDPRVKGTVEAIERELMPDGLVLRYNSSTVPDGLPPGEGVFLACSFWMVSSLKAIGRIDDARALFDKLLTLRNDVGLLSEEYDVGHKRLVGNFPQAFSHIALVNAAFDLEDGTKMRERAHRHLGQAAKPTD